MEVGVIWITLSRPLIFGDRTVVGADAIQHVKVLQHTFTMGSALSYLVLVIQRLT